MLCVPVTGMALGSGPCGEPAWESGPLLPPPQMLSPLPEVGAALLPVSDSHETKGQTLVDILTPPPQSPSTYLYEKLRYTQAILCTGGSHCKLCELRPTQHGPPLTSRAQSGTKPPFDWPKCTEIAASY